MISQHLAEAFRLAAGELRAQPVMYEYMTFIEALQGIKPSADASVHTFALYLLSRIEQQERRIAKLEDIIAKRHVS